jgi:hypothetical protein
MPRGSNWQSAREERIYDRKRVQADARAEWGEWLRDKISPTVFGTLTFRPSAQRAISDAAACRAYARFLQNASELLDCDVTGVITNEHTKAGAPHGHPLLSISRPHRVGDAHLLERAWKRSHRKAGMTRFERPRSTKATGVYVGKYVVKSEGDIVFSPGFGGTASPCPGPPS